MFFYLSDGSKDTETLSGGLRLVFPLRSLPGWQYKLQSILLLCQGPRLLSTSASCPSPNFVPENSLHLIYVPASGLSTPAFTLTVTGQSDSSV